MAELRAHFRDGGRSAILCEPTGAGKTATAAYMIDRAAARGKRCAFVAHRRELVFATSQRLAEHGVEHGIVMGDERADPHRLAQVCSIQTLARRAQARLAEYDFVVVDECHHATSQTYIDFLAASPRAHIVGLSATPCRLDGRGLGYLFQKIVHNVTVNKLIERQYLVRPRVFAPSRPDLAGVHARGGDYIASELQDAMDRPKLVGNVVETWAKLGEGRTTVAFAVGVKHSLHVVEAFRAIGINAAHLDADTPPDERADILAGLDNGSVQLVSNVGILTEGWDCPRVSCVILDRPTYSLALYLQMVGRSLRPWPGKADCLVLDHADCTRRHGFATEEREWTLEGFRRQTRADESFHVTVCKNCYAAYESGSGPCPYCGTVNAVVRKGPKREAGELAELDERTYNIRRLSRNPQVRMLQEIARRMQYKPGWVFLQMERMRRGLKPLIPEKAKTRPPEP